MSKKIYLFFVTLAVPLFFITGCNNQSAEEKIHKHLEEAVQSEEEIEEGQQEINELKQKEQELYNEILDMDMEQFDQIQELSQEAISTIEVREEKIAEERESMEASEEAFSNVESEVEDLEDETVRALAEEMYTIMEERYEAYYHFSDVYQSSINQEKTLYELLQQEDLKQETLTEHINELNDTYKQTIDLNEQFNQLTVAYNEAKRAFYDASSLNVSYDNEDVE